MDASLITARLGRTGFGVLTILAVASLGACGASGDTDAAKRTTPTSSLETTTTVDDSTGTPQATPVDNFGSRATGSASSAGSSGGGQTATPPTTPSTAPRITGLSVPKTISCYDNESPAYTGPSPTYTASWSTTNAVKVTISLDGPGIYDSYGPNGSTSLGFPCGDQPHTLLLTAFSASGETTTELRTIRPHHVQPESGAESADGESPADS